MKIIIALGLSFFIFAVCPATFGQESQLPSKSKTFSTELSDLYTEPVIESMYSKQVGDTLRLFKSFPKAYLSDTSKKYPAIIILDANAYFESVVSQLKFSTFIGEIPKAIIIGLGYKNFSTMDSLRARDYTYPKAIPEYEMSVSGGADRFKRFIDEELLPKLSDEYRIDLEKSTLCGHSLGGYFTLFYSLKSAEENRFTIKNIVSASPSLHYNHRYIFGMARAIQVNNMPMKVYISMGSGDMADEESKGILHQFANVLIGKKFKELKLEQAEYTNFGHIDAAIPGFIKGLTHIYKK